MPCLPAPLLLLVAACALALAAGGAQAGAQQYEPMAASVRAALHAAVSDAAAPMLPIPDAGERAQWLAEMSRRLQKRIPDEAYRKELLTTIHYEATRAGLDPQMVLGLIQVESAFRKYALSTAGARGYMQVMPFCASAAPSCATTSTSRRATSTARSAATTAAWASRSIRTWSARRGRNNGRGGSRLQFAVAPAPTFRVPTRRMELMSRMRQARMFLHARRT